MNAELSAISAVTAGKGAGRTRKKRRMSIRITRRRTAYRGGAWYGGMASEPLVGPPNWNDGESTMFDMARVV